MSPVLVIATGTVTGQVVNSLGQPVSGLPVVAKLNAGVSTPQTISPVGQQVPGEVTAFTDSTGAWSLALVPNNNVNPSNSTYTIQIPGLPDVYVQLNDTASHVYTSIAVNPTTAVLAPAGQTVAQLTVTGELDVTGPAVFHGPDPWVDITHPAFGGKGDGSTDNSPALTAALAALPSTGGTIYFPPSASLYVFASAWNLASKNFIRLKGAGPAATGGAGTSSLVRFTGTSGPLISAGSSTGLELEDLYVQWPSAFTGTVCDFSGSTLNRIRGCSFFANGGGTNAALILGLDNAIMCSVERAIFHNAKVGIQGIATGGHFSNAIQIERCIFSSATGDVLTAHISNPGQGWLIHGNTFEMGTGAGTPVAIGQSLGGSLGVSVVGNWFGDAGAGALTYIDINGDGWHIAGNILGSNGNAGSILVRHRSGAQGLHVAGNRMQSAGIGVQLDGNNTGVAVIGNRVSGVTNLNSGVPTSGMLQSATGVGGIRTFGSWERQQQTPTETVLVSGVDATAGEHVEVTLTAARVVGAPANPSSGQHLWFTLIQGGAGGFTVTWNAMFKVTWADTGNTTGKRSTVGFWYDGTNWNQLAAQVPYV